MRVSPLQVPTQECREVYRQKCEKVPKKECKTVYDNQCKQTPYKVSIIFIIHPSQRRNS